MNFQVQDFDDEPHFDHVDEGVNEEFDYSLEDPQILADEQERLEKVMLETASLYNVTSVLKEIVKCKCGALRESKAPTAAVSLQGRKTCRSCGCSKAGSLCTERCSCSIEFCLNRTKVKPYVSRDVSFTCYVCHLILISSF